MVQLAEGIGVHISPDVITFTARSVILPFTEVPALFQNTQLVSRNTATA